MQLCVPRPGLLALAALACVLASSPARADHPTDPRAVKIADEVMATLGGKARWDSLTGLRWAFGIMVNDTVRGPMRRHSWNKTTGWHRVEGRGSDGNLFVLIHKLGTPEGSAWVAGRKMEGDTLQALLQRAQSFWATDTYWILMPYQLRDPGVNLAYVGDEMKDGLIYDKLALTFDNAGATPGNRYWIYVNRANHRIERWDYILQGEKPPPQSWTWEKWEMDGGLWFAGYHHGTEGRTILTIYPKTVAKFEETEFSKP